MKKLAVTFVALAVMTGMAAAQTNTSEPSQVDVTVTSTSAIDVHPANLDYTTAEVGEQNTTSDRGFTAVDLENTGSENVTKIWADADTPSNDPFGTGGASEYNSGNFLEIKPNSGVLSGDTSAYHAVNRVEFITNNTSEIPSWIDVDGQFDSTGVNDGDVFVGALRAGDEEYYFAIPTQSAGTCDGASGGSGEDILRLAQVPHTDTQIGTYDFTDSGTDWEQHPISTLTSSTTGFGITGDVNTSDGTASGVTIEVDGSNRTYDLLTKCDVANPRVVRTRYNVDYDDGDVQGDGQTTQYLFNAPSNPNELAPGDFVTMDVAIRIPRGVAQGAVSQGNLRVKVTTD